MKSKKKKEMDFRKFSKQIVKRAREKKEMTPEQERQEIIKALRSVARGLKRQKEPIKERRKKEAKKYDRKARDEFIHQLYEERLKLPKESKEKLKKRIDTLMEQEETLEGRIGRVEEEIKKLEETPIIDKEWKKEKK